MQSTFTFLFTENLSSSSVRAIYFISFGNLNPVTDFFPDVFNFFYFGVCFSRLKTIGCSKSPFLKSTHVWLSSEGQNFQDLNSTHLGTWILYVDLHQHFKKRSLFSNLQTFPCKIFSNFEFHSAVWIILFWFATFFVSCDWSQRKCLHSRDVINIFPPCKIIKKHKSHQMAGSHR